MIVKVNGVEIVKDKVKGVIENTEWYQYEHPSFDLVNNFPDVQTICKQDIACYMDSMNWSIMNKTELTSSIYKFITHRVYVIKDGFQNNFLPDDWESAMQAWEMILDFALWFI